MSTATNFSTNNRTFRQLLGNGLTYFIPPFQRDYSWTSDEWEELWLDILGTIEPGGEPAHYMGYLVLQTSDDRTFTVIDGQQRLTTLSLMVLGVLKNLRRLIDHQINPADNTVRYNQLYQAYIGFIDPVTLVPQTKLTLNRNNDRYYQQYLVKLVEKLPSGGGIRASEHGLRRAFIWFERRIRDYIAEHGGDHGPALASFVERLSDRLFFTVILVTDELNAYKVFETLNARGVRLSATDLLKNYLFAVLDRGGVHQHGLDALENHWETIIGRLGNENFPDFLRMHWISRQSPIRQTELFKAMRGTITDPSAVFALLDAIDEDLETYLALRQPEISDWPRTVQDDAAALRRFDVSQPIPLLLAAGKRFEPQAFASILRATVVISLRYNVIGGLSTGDQQSAYNAVIRGLRDGALATASDVIQALAPIYPSDQQFRDLFRGKSFGPRQPRANRITRYLLCKIESHIGGVETDLDSATLSIEHVLPRSAGPGWIDFPLNDGEAFAYRLGNLTLLEETKNKALDNADYAAKRPIYETSRFAMTRRLALENAEWTPARIDARQAWMANQAVAIWRISQLSATISPLPN